jgi:hypothetical protein
MHFAQYLTYITAILPVAMALAVPAPVAAKDVSKREIDREDFYFFGISYDALIP